MFGFKGHSVKWCIFLSMVVYNVFSVVSILTDVINLYSLKAVIGQIGSLA